ncbi:MAG: hypothetical protein J0H25_08155, partial [Rhizobiales bacterium]|nr:hypothetical protein [Hyphomicrobiales bacterium]
MLAYNESSGRFTIGKTLTTPDDPARAVQTGVGQLVQDAGAKPTDVEQIVHGTTLVTNALIERKGAKTALITTEGFRDALEIAREHRYDLYDLFLELPKPLVPRSLRFELNERVFADGSIHKALDDAEVIDLIQQLQADGIEAVAVSLIHSYQNPAHERRVAELLAEHAPEMIVSISSDVVPELREYKRTSTTVANVHVRPIIVHYL